MYNSREVLMYQAKVAFIAMVLMLFSSVTQAQESEGVIKRAYKKSIQKDKIAENKPTEKKTDLRSRTTYANGGIAGEDVRTTYNDDLYGKMSKTEIIQEIKGEVDSEDGILEQMPKLKMQKGKDGKSFYSYLIDGKQVKLEDVDENILRTILRQVSEKSEKISIEAMQENMEQLKAVRYTRPPQLPSKPASSLQRPVMPPQRPATTPQRPSTPSR